MLAQTVFKVANGAQMLIRADSPGFADPYLIAAIGRIKSIDDPLHAMALEYFFTGSTQLCAIPLQALLNGHIVTQLFSAKAGSIARTRLLLLGRSEMAALCRCRT
jgi:hypothetical protein